MSIFDWLAENPEVAPIKPKEYAKSVAKILKKIETSSKKGDRARTAWLYQTASVLARRAKSWDDSVKYALLAGANSEHEGKLFNAGWSYRSAAIASLEKKDYKNAVIYAMKGADSFMLSKSGYAAKWCYQLAGLACKKGGDPERAIKFYERAYEIERDEETEGEIERLKHLVSHPTVDQYAERGEVREYEPVRFEVVVENHGREPIKNIIIGDRNAKLTHEIASLRPGEVKVFSYDTKGKLGCMLSPYNCITWQNAKGKTFDMELEPARVLVRPKVQVSSYISPGPVINKTSELAVLVKNLSSAPLYDIKLDLDFPAQIKSAPSSPNTIKKIAPGEELGADWKIKPGLLGMQKVASGKVVMLDENGISYEEEMPAVTGEVLEKEQPERKMFAKKDEFRQEKKHFDSSITAYELSESQYVELSKMFWNQHKGYTFRGAGLDVVLHHVEENCKDMALVSKHELEHERMILYSFKLAGTHYLLTVIIKEEEGFIHLIFKLYSEKSDVLVPTLDRISNIIRYTIKTETEASEVEHVEIKKIINIVDSIVQRSKIGAGGEEGEVTDKKTKISDSVVQRTET
jgi:tetratricopeptide (TPR) repeat protein